jgi:hypothetical protein
VGAIVRVGEEVGDRVGEMIMSRSITITGLVSLPSVSVELIAPLIVSEWFAGSSINPCVSSKYDPLMAVFDRNVVNNIVLFRWNVRCTCGGNSEPNSHAICSDPFTRTLYGRLPTKVTANRWLPTCVRHASRKAHLITTLK